MLARYSVRKPFTALVGVVLVLVLGVVSFMNTSTDLLPAMDLPFSAVFTVYPGATPEQVEAEISIPLEARMSTLGGIQTVQSISSEHVSIIILEFSETTNMDAALLELREALDMMTLPDGAQRPMTIRMNPEMLPIMMANVHFTGMEVDALSYFATRTVGPALEGVPGVAAVAFSGLVQNQLHVIIRGELIQAVNERINLAVAAMIEAAMQEMQHMLEQAAAMQVQAASEARMAELLAEGLDMEAAQLALMGEMPQITQTVTQEVMREALAAQGEQAETAEIAIPAELLSVDTIAGLLGAQNFAMPAGVITDSDIQYMVRVGDRFDDYQEIIDMVIFDPEQFGLADFGPVRLSDIADVFPTDDAHLSFSEVNGERAVMFSIQRQSEYPTADVAEAVRARMDSLAEEFPGLGFAILMDQGEMIGMVVGSVLNTLIIGGILAVVILLLFLRDIRPTLIVAVSIPVSLMLAFTLMYFTGISLNMISMGGLALAVGMLVDNSIVVIENIYRMRQETGRSAARAAISGAVQVSGAITAATLTTIALFVPIVFTGGITRQLFMDFGLTIAFSLLASLIIALSVVPAASSVILGRTPKNQEGRIFTKFVDFYERMLKLSLQGKWIVLVAVLAAFFTSFWAILQRGAQLFPPMDAPQVTVSAQMPDDATFEEATHVASEFSRQVRQIDDVHTVGVSVGGGGMLAMLGAGMGIGGFGGGEPSTSITMYVLLEDGRTITGEELNARILDISETLDLDASVDGADGGMGMMMGDAISIRVEGVELDDIRDTAIALAELVSSVEGTLNVTDMVEDAAPEMRIVVDKNAAMAHGLNVATVFMAVAGALSSPERSIDMAFGGMSYEVIVSDGDFTPPELQDLANMELVGMMGSTVLLSDIAAIHEDSGFTSISRINRNRFVTISGEIDDGFNVGLVNAEIEARLQDFEPIGASRVVIGGEAEAIAEAFGDLVLMLALGLLFTYLIMVAQFQSLMSPFIVMFTVPLAFTGGFASLILLGMPLSIVSIIGLILLSGVAVNNGIVLISRINQMRLEGMAKRDAIIDAGRKRIRPILMTAVSTIFAMSVLAMGFGEGTEMMQPMAVATIGGLLYATVTTLFVVPILYDLLHRNKDITQESFDDEL